VTNWPIMSLRPCSPLGFKSGQVGADTQRWHSTRLLSRIGQVGADAQRRRPGPQNHKRKLSGCMRSPTCSPTYFCQHSSGTSTMKHIVLSTSCIVPAGTLCTFPSCIDYAKRRLRNDDCTSTAHLSIDLSHRAHWYALHISILFNNASCRSLCVLRTFAQLPQTDYSPKRNHLFQLSVFNCTPKQRVC